MHFSQTKILYLCGDLSLTGGIEKYNSDFISAIKLSGSKVKVVQRRVGAISSKISFVFYLFISIFTFRPTHIVCAHLHFSSLALIISQVLRIKYSVSIYGIEAIEIRKKIHQIALNKAEKIIVISEYTKKLVNSQFNFSSEKYFMLISSVTENSNNFIEDTAFLKNKYGLGGAPVVLTISRCSPSEEKGQHRVVISFKEVLKNFPDAKYVMAGPGKDHRIDKALALYPITNKSVINLGRVSDEQRTELYNLCDVFVLPSKNEGFGIVFIEALASGARVIASNGYGCKEGLLNGTLGTLVEPDDTNQIANAISHELAKSRVLRDRMEIRNKTLEVYGYEAWCQKIVNFLIQIGSK